MCNGDLMEYDYHCDYFYDYGLMAMDQQQTGKL